MAGFSHHNGQVTCDGRLVQELATEAGATPFFLYSKDKVTENYQLYQKALASLPVPFFVGYAVKANNNLAILKHLSSLGCGAVLVSGWELRLAQMAGIDSSKLIFNGNGKRISEIEEAISAGCYVNIDSEFDLGHISAAAKRLQKKCSVLLRVNPDIDAKVHPYLATGVDTCKFGMRSYEVPSYLDRIKEDEWLDLAGVHSHMGSTIKEVSVFRDSLAALLVVVDEINSRGFNVRVVNIGGGLGIDYSHTTTWITPQDLADSVRSMLEGRSFALVVEPGRSIIANAGALLEAMARQ